MKRLLTILLLAAAMAWAAPAPAGNPDAPEKYPTAVTALRKP